MRSRAEVAARLASLVVVMACSACSTASPSATAIETTVLTPTPTEDGTALPEPGRPFDTASVLASMRDSRRPDGVPAQLQSEAVAEAVADAIWTIDGQPWSTSAVSGTCGAQTCTLEMAGTRPSTAGDDVWVFNVIPGDGSVELVTTELRALPTDLIEALDRLARSLAEPERLPDLALTSVRWLPPPDEGRFVLAYRSGGEEGSCRMELTMDAPERALVSQEAEGC